ncbi:FkbM family methyltransferase [Aphanizomenon sp. CS-733/32]|uniref:FkbM family methyltransferase n=1 Tax=Aphanizomenon sp. CS-733/32 TaxID=3021715 RepID=UPI00233118F8|nr:FkbM family methyltransferase [Aphanizomenon sp. CS-733/32]MDB9308639.1 FkbM family methyltransferase [Aphanizomenon sp. CS-733/32]
MKEFFVEWIRQVNFPRKAGFLHLICPKVGEKTIDFYGYELSLDLSDYIQRSAYLNVFEPYESNLIKNYLKTGMTFIDVGANIGYFTLMAAALVGSEGKVIAFEPSSYAYNRLKNTVNRNNISQVSLVQAGLSDSESTIQLYIPDNQWGNHSPTMIKNNSGQPINVPVFRLDEYLKSNNIAYVDLMKIDVEGFEPNVIEGAREAIESKKIHSILIEFNKYWLECNGSSVASLYQKLLELGFKSKTQNIDINSSLQNLFFSIE